MSNPHLLPEILDHIIDVMHNRPGTLKKCYLNSKPWAPRTQKDLFCRIGILSAEHLESWKKAFPGPSSNSALGLLRRQMQKKVVGSKPVLVLYT